MPKTDGNAGLKDMLVDVAIGTTVGAGIGGLAEVAANVSLFGASLLLASLVMLGSGASLGGLLGATAGAAIAHLRKALDLMPDDPQSIFGLATALETVGTDEADEEADALYLRLIEEHPTSPMVEQAEKSRTAFGHKRLKSGSVGGFRPDVMMYIAGALQTFKKVGPKKRHEIAVEIALLGRSGLDINDPSGKYKLKSLSGKFTGLHLLAIMYTAFRQIDPTMETGADFGAEYQAALQMQKK